MGLFKKFKKSVRKAIRSPSHSRLSSVLSLGAIGKHNGRYARRLGISRNKIMSAIGFGSPSYSGYNSAAAYQPRRISSMMGGAQ